MGDGGRLRNEPEIEIRIRADEAGAEDLFASAEIKQTLGLMLGTALPSN
jgi:hypothetical protein